jgi:Outer membrane protein beta-barrel domain
VRKGFVGIGTILLCAMAAAAQDAPQMEMFLGYTYVRTSSTSNAPSFDANGGGGQYAYNFNRWISGVADLGVVHNGNIAGSQLDNTIVGFLFGPRISLRHPRIRPYFQVLIGGVYSTSSLQIAVEPVLPISPVLPGEAVTARVAASQTAFAMTAGGGLDVKIGKHVGFRPVQLEYFMTRIQNLRTEGDNNQNNLRYSTGFNFTFGKVE